MRSLHRDIGFFVVGLTLIYGVSGLILTYRNTDFLKSETQMEKTIAPNLKANQLSRALHQEVKLVNESDQEIIFNTGTYNKETGLVSYSSLELPWILRQFNGLHFVSGNDARHWFTSLFAVCLLFLAVSSFWMYKPGSRYFKRGIYIAGSGFAAAMILILV